MLGSLNWNIIVQAGLGERQDPMSKITRAKRVGGMAQSVQHLPSKCKALNSNSSTANAPKKKKKKQKNCALRFTELLNN
jgi:hypothetical protein